MGILKIMFLKVLEFFMHLAEFQHDLRHDEYAFRRRPAAPRPSAPKDSTCYPYHRQLDHEQLVFEDDLL